MLLTSVFTAGVTLTEDFLRLEKIDMSAMLEANDRFLFTLMTGKQNSRESIGQLALSLRDIFFEFFVYCIIKWWRDIRRETLFPNLVCPLG